MATLTTEVAKTQARQAVLGWVSDPDHAWLAVSLDSEHGFPSALSFGSSSSYLDITGDNFAGIVYLEEDDDAVKFMNFYELHFSDFQVFDLPEDNTIRDLPRATN
jgi:hypothetical protein